MLRDDQVRVFWMSRIDYEKNSGVKSHFHDDIYQLLFFITGEGQLQLNDESFEIVPNHVYFIPKRATHSFSFTGPTSSIDIKFDILNPEVENLFKEGTIAVPYFIDDSTKLKELFKLSVMNLKQSTSLIPYRIDVGFKDILLSILQDHTVHQDNSPRLIHSVKNEFHADFPVIEYLSEHLTETITLEDIARHFNFHPHYIIELFRKKFDTTPMKLLQELRIEKSKEYLEFSNYTITEISELIGLSAPYFSRLFHAKEGVSPTIYREQARTVIGKHILLEEEFSPSLKNQPKISNLFD